MAINVYVISEPSVIDFIEDGDLEGFKEELTIDETLIFHDPETFDTEAEVKLLYLMTRRHSTQKRRS